MPIPGLLFPDFLPFPPSPRAWLVPVSSPTILGVIFGGKMGEIYRFSASWLRSKCSICSYQLNI